MKQDQEARLTLRLRTDPTTDIDLALDKRRITLSKILDNQIRIFRMYGVPEYFAAAKQHLELKKVHGFAFAQAFDNARQAVYLGDIDSGFHTSYTQLRAIKNIDLGTKLIHESCVTQGLFTATSALKPLSEKMPEAVWQYNIAYDGVVFGRVGVNLHLQQGNLVASIPNIQGKQYEVISRVNQLGEPWTHKALAMVLTALPAKTMVRGIPSALHPSRTRDGFDKHRASCLYDYTFRRMNFAPVRTQDGAVAYYEKKT